MRKANNISHFTFVKPYMYIVVKNNKMIPGKSLVKISLNTLYRNLVGREMITIFCLSSRLSVVSSIKCFGKGYFKYTCYAAQVLGLLTIKWLSLSVKYKSCIKSENPVCIFLRKGNRKHSCVTNNLIICI